MPNFEDISTGWRGRIKISTADPIRDVTTALHVCGECVGRALIIDRRLRNSVEISVGYTPTTGLHDAILKVRFFLSGSNKPMSLWLLLDLQFIADSAMTVEVTGGTALIYERDRSGPDAIATTKLPNYHDRMYRARDFIDYAAAIKDHVLNFVTVTESL
jgi:hypothetical protein